MESYNRMVDVLGQTYEYDENKNYDLILDTYMKLEKSIYETGSYEEILHIDFDDIWLYAIQRLGSEPDRFNKTLLHYAKNVNHVKIILDKVDNPMQYCEIKDIYGRHPLHYIKNIECGKLLLENVADKNLYCTDLDKYGYNALYNIQNEEISKLLL